MSDEEMSMIHQETQVPRFPVITNPNEPDPLNFEVKPKMSMSDDGGLAELLITPDDMPGLFSYIPDVKSMSLSASTDQANALNKDMEMVLNPVVQQMLAAQGVKVKIKDLLVSIMDSHGRQNASKLFEDVAPTQPAMPAGMAPQQQPQGMPQMPAPQGLTLQ
jgi:hypothetical protein